MFRVAANIVSFCAATGASHIVAVMLSDKMVKLLLSTLLTPVVVAAEEVVPLSHMTTAAAEPAPSSSDEENVSTDVEEARIRAKMRWILASRRTRASRRLTMCVVLFWFMRRKYLW